MSIRKQGTSSDQKVDPSDDPGQGQGIRREASIPPRGHETSQPLSDGERDEIIRGEG